MYGDIPTGRQPTRTTNAMVAAPHSLASSAGLDVLRDGGSAVDAAIAVNAVLAVAYPHMAGVGGDGFWLLSTPDGSVRGINASGPAAAAATPEWYRDRGHEEIPDRGASAALTVPGAVDGWRLAHEEHGTLPWERLFTDAVAHARDGVPVTQKVATWIHRDQEVLRGDDEAAGTFLVDGTPPAPGARLRQSNLAETLETIRTRGPREGFYEGAVATEFCRALGPASPLDPADFEGYRAEWVEPLSVEYGDYTAYELPPNTQGLTALQILGILDGCDVERWGDGTTDYYHHLAEATKLAFADRDAWVTDPAVLDIPTDELLDADYLAERRTRIAADATLPQMPPPGIEPTDHDTVDGAAGGDTCYFTVVDEDGMAVSAIQSIYFDFGSGVVAGETGVVPQNRGAYFSLDETSVNALEPGKRPFHTLIPAMLTSDGEPWLCYGTMGGEGQPQTQAALVTRIADFGYDVQRAIEAPRWLFGRTWGAESRSLSLEGRIPDGVGTALAARGHDVSFVQDYDATMGHAQAIRIHADGTLSGGADPRGDGTAIGY